MPKPASITSKTQYLTALAALLFLSVSSPKEIDNSTDEEARQRILAGINAEDSSDVVSYVKRLPCRRLLRAGVSARNLGVDEDDAGPVLRAIDKRLTSDACAEYGQKVDIIGEIDLGDDGSFCFECYSKYNQRLVDWLEDLRETQERYREIEHPVDSLQTRGDFRVSATGMLIHETCLEEGRFQFDVEKAVVDGLIHAFSWLIETEKEEVVDWSGEASAISRIHVPNFIDLYNPENWVMAASASIGIYERTAQGSRQSKVIEINQPRDFLRKHEESHGIDIPENCHFFSEIEKFRPKLFCDLDMAGLLNAEMREANAFASNPTRSPSLWIFESESEARIYHPPGIVFNPERTRDWTSTRFQSTLFHEHFHHFGWKDEAHYKHNSYPYFCQAGAFYRLTHEDVLDDNDFLDGIHGCIQLNYDQDMPYMVESIRNSVVLDND